jgi:hypothetical protein
VRHGWRARWHGGIGSVADCPACRYACPVDALCAGCRICRACRPGAWRVCAEGVRDCGPYCLACEPVHAH